jgi:hypothetical protein
MNAVAQPIQRFSFLNHDDRPRTSVVFGRENEISYAELRSNFLIVDCWLVELLQGQDLVFETAELAEEVASRPTVSWIFLEHAVEYMIEIFTVVFRNVFHEILLLQGAEFKFVAAVEMVAVS